MERSLKPPLVFFGNERIATGVTTEAPTLQALLKEGYKVGLVVIAQNQAGPSRKAQRNEVLEIAKSHNIPVLIPEKLKDKDTIKQIAAVGAQAAVLVAFGKIVPKEILDIFPQGIINIHPSLLPKHRGSTPIESAILNGDIETGVSLMKLVSEMDAGPIYAQETVLLRGDEDKQILANQLLNIGKNMLLAHLPEILDGSLKPREQDTEQVTTDGRISKDDGELVFKEKSAERLAREVRAYTGWPRSRTIIGTTEVIITKAHAADVSGMATNLWLGNRQLGIHAKEGTLIIDALIPAGKREMPASAFLSGYQPKV